MQRGGKIKKGLEKYVLCFNNCVYTHVWVEFYKYMNVFFFHFAGSCTFDEGFSQCDYQQDSYDDFDWTHINTQEVPYISPDLPKGEASYL